MSKWTNVVAVIDDDPDVLFAIDRLLAAHGYERERYRSAGTFLAAAATSKATCVIVDVHLGKDNGVALVCQLRQNGFVIPVIFITGSDDERVRQRALNAGCVGFFRKPFVPEALVAAVAEARRAFE